MSKNSSLLLVESEMTKAKGHFLDYLIETSCYFKKNKTITWFLNKNFDSQNLYIPEYCSVKKIIKSNNFKRKVNKFYYFLEEFYFFILNFYNIFFFSFFLLKNKKKLFSFYKCLLSNYFIIPRYFKSFYLEFLKLNFNVDDNIIFQSCRRKDIALVYFLSSIELDNLPKIHLRVFLPPNKRFKDFYFYLNKIKNNLQKNIYLYTEDGFKKNMISSEIGDISLINTTTPIFNFYERKVTLKKHVIGFIGEARVNKGFNKIPDLIKILNNSNNDLKFIIQFSGTDNSTVKTANKLYELSKHFKNIKIIKKYCDYQEYRKILQNITIMPLMYDSDHMNNTNSGIVYSCISNEIIPIIPKDCEYLKRILADNSFREADNVESFAQNINIIQNDYANILKKAKISSKNFSKIIDNGSMIKNIG